jgi:endoglucanase
VYIDAGNARWVGAADMAARLKSAGIGQADGFSLNVSNFITTAANVAYGEAVSARVSGKHFIIDTSRNGMGGTADGQWCNPSGQALGEMPTTRTGHRLVDAYLWIKYPGESDGPCNGGPSAGAWWPEYALGLARQEAVLLAAKN